MGAEEIVCNSIYKKRIVAFVDILGFKTHIERSVENPDHAKTLLNVLKRVALAKSVNDSGLLPLKEHGKEVTSFSDCIVISYPLDYKGGLFHILIDLIHIQLDLLFNGIVLRGGITVGDVFHDDNIAFGPALVKAYDLESKVAKYPRIVIEEETIIKGIIETLPSGHTVEMELEYVQDLLKEDGTNEKLYYLDTLAQYQELDDNYYYYEMLDIVRNLILQEMDNNKTNQSVLEKYHWFKDYYNDTVDRFNLQKYRI